MVEGIGIVQSSDRRYTVMSNGEWRLLDWEKPKEPVKEEHTEPTPHDIARLEDDGGPVPPPEAVDVSNV